jgi:putative oxidoreductase
MGHSKIITGAGTDGLYWQRNRVRNRRLFCVGLITRIAAVLMVTDMLFICFKIGSGKFYYEDQHPFLFALIALVFFFTGPVKWSLDMLWFGKR